MKWIPSGVLIKVHFAKLGVRGKLPAGRWLYTPNRMQYFRRISAAGKCPDILQDSHWPLVWMISRLNREDEILYKGSLDIENDLYHLHLLRVIVPQGTQGIRVSLSEDYPLPPSVSLNRKCWFYFIVLFELGDIITISLHLVHPKPLPKSLDQNAILWSATRTPLPKVTSNPASPLRRLFQWKGRDLCTKRHMIWRTRLKTPLPRKPCMWGLAIL